MRTFTIFKTLFMSTLLLLLCNMNALAQCTLSEDFENMDKDAAYAGRIITTPSGEWMILGYSQMDNNDRYLNTKSIRLRANNNDPANNAMTIPGEGTTGANVIQMQFDKPNGVGSVSFYYGSYSTHNGGTVSVEYSTNGGTAWIKPANNAVTAPKWADVGEMRQFTVPINVQGNVRIRIIKYKQSGTANSVNVDNLCVTDFNPAGYVASPTFNPSGGSYAAPINVVISSTTAGATIRYTLDGSDPTTSSTQYSTPIAISTQTTLKAGAWKEGMQPSTISTANYIFPESVSTLAALRAQAPPYTGGNNAGTAVYKFTGQAVLTQMQDNNGVKYIQDETAAIYIFDPNKKITAGKEIGDKLTNISGTLTNYFGMIEFVPVEDCDVPVSWDNKVPAVVITASQLNYAHDNPIQAKVVHIKDVFYASTGDFAKGAYLDLKENNIKYDSVVYLEKYEANYIGTPIPTYLTNIKGVINFKGGQGFATRNRIVPLDNGNPVVQKITDINLSAIKLSPNPATNYVDIVSGIPMKLEIYSLLGNLVAVENLNEGSNTISVSQYAAGIYIMKFIDTTNGQTLVQKLVVR